MKYIALGKFWNQTEFITKALQGTETPEFCAFSFIAFISLENEGQGLKQERRLQAALGWPWCPERPAPVLDSGAGAGAPSAGPWATVKVSPCAGKSVFSSQPAG